MLIKEIISRLREPIDKRLLKTKKLGGQAITFISWYDTCQLLDIRAELWSWHIDNVVTTEDRLIVYGTLTIIGDDRQLSMSATGTETLDCSSFGDPSSNAEAMAFKRACAKFGLARYLYDKELRETYKGYDATVKVTTEVVKTVPSKWTADCGMSFKEWKLALGK